MKITQLIPEKTNLTILCDTYLVEEPESFEELLEAYKEYRQNNPGKTVILTLDDLGQAQYTSTHATISKDLDDPEGYDLTGIDAACFEDGEHIGYLSTPSEFFIRKENFLKQVNDLDFSTACKKELAIDEDELSILEEINESPLDYLDKQILLKVVPVEKSYEGICGFPNGYFTCDLSPFENYALAKHLSEKYGYELLGIGASLLGFIRNEKLEEEQIDELISDLAQLYHTEEEVFEDLAEFIRNNEYLFLKYVECLED